MKNKTFGLIYLEPDELILQVFERPSMKLITEVRSGTMQVGAHPVANYAHNLVAIVNSLTGFQRVLADYGVEQTKLYGNREDLSPVAARYVADQIEVRTGLKIHWLNTSQLIADTLSRLMTKLPHFDELSKKSLYVLSMGLNTSTLAYFRHGKFQMSWDIDLGGARLSQLVTTLRQTTTNPSEIILDYISSKLEYLVPELRHVKKSRLLIQNVSTLAQSFVPAGEQLGEVPREEFEQRYQSLITATDQYIISHYDVNEQSVNWVLPNYLVAERVIHLLNAKHVYATNISVLDGVTTAASGGQQLISQMIRTSADNLAQRYGADSKHNAFVAALAVKLFDALQPIHRLSQNDRLLLEIASKVDDIGNFINPQAHYRHSAYILEANPLIGLSDKDNHIVAEVARYHSMESPHINQRSNTSLDLESQITVGKLAAILRMADSLDDSRQQKIKQVRLRLHDDELQILAKADDDLVVEQWAFQKKSQLFKAIYGLKPVLITKEED